MKFEFQDLKYFSLPGVLDNRFLKLETAQNLHCSVFLQCIKVPLNANVQKAQNSAC